jgi:hypothetical protein
MPAGPKPTLPSRAWSLDVMVGLAAAVAIVVVVLFMRPQKERDEASSAARPLQPVGREPLKVSERLRPRSEAEMPPPPPAWHASADEPIRVQGAVAPTPARMKPGAAVAVRADDTEPTPRPGVAADLPPEAIDLDNAAEDIGALTKVAFGDPDPERRLGAVELLSATEDPQVITVLARSLADQNEEVRMAALQALSDFTGEAPAVAIEGALHDPSADIRYEAVSMLAEVGTDRARSAIQQALSDPDEDVRFLAESVLELHDAPDAGHVPAGPVHQQPPIR